MSEKQLNVSDQNPARASQHNPFLLVAGFIVLGIAAAVLLFGQNLFGGSDAAAPVDDGVVALVEEVEPAGSIIDQIGELEVSEPVIAQIPSSLGGPVVGQTMPDFVLADLEGNSVRLSDLKGQPVIVNFWATWCAPCRVEMPEFQATHEAYGADGLVILAVNRDESPEEVAAYFQELGLTFTALLDQGGLVADAYEVFNMPSTYFVNEAGIVTAVHRGPLVQSQLDGYLAVTLAAEG